MIDKRMEPPSSGWWKGGGWAFYVKQFEVQSPLYHFDNFIPSLPVGISSLSWIVLFCPNGKSFTPRFPKNILFAYRNEATRAAEMSLKSGKVSNVSLWEFLSIFPWWTTTKHWSFTHSKFLVPPFATPTSKQRIRKLQNWPNVSWLEILLNLVVRERGKLKSISW